MNITSRGQPRISSLAALAAAVAGTLFCIVQTYRTAQLPDGDASGMQWVILTLLTLLFVFMVVPL